MMRSQTSASYVRRPEVLADALDQVRPPAAAGVDRAHRVGADHLHPALADLLEVAAGAADRAAGADAGDEVGDPAVGLAPQLRAGGLVVAERVVRVGVLVRLPAAVDVPGEPVGDRVVGVRMVRFDRGRADHHLGAVRHQHVALVLADLVRADEHAVVAALLGHQRQAHTGVARGRLDDGAAGSQQPLGLGGVDHAHRDAVLDAAAGVEVLDLGEHPGAGVGRGDAAEPDQGGVADEVDHGVDVVHRVTRRRTPTVEGP